MKHKQITSDEKLLILKQRAKQLAQEGKATNQAKPTIEALEFLLGDEKYAIESCFIREVYPLKGFTVLPSVPPFLTGVINIRRRIVSIIDLKYFFDIPYKETGKSNKLIIIENELIDFAIIADEIVGVRFFAIEDIQNSIPTLTGIRQEYLKGITSDRVVLLDGNKLLTDKQIVIDETS